MVLIPLIINFIIMDIDPKIKKKKVYIPLKKILELVIKRVRALDIQVPLSHIARMDLAGEFQDESLKPLKKQVYNYLRTANKYRQIYFESMKKSKLVFDTEMTKDGSFAPGLKQYESLKNQLFDELLKTDGKVWVTSYDQYLPTIREHADKRSKEPRSGQRMFKSLRAKIIKDLKEIKRLQVLTIKKSKTFKKDLDQAIKNPQLTWGEWNERNQK
jgi:hypothetical protein